MNLQDAVKSIIKPHTEDKLANLTTPWGEKILMQPQNVLPEYPRPQMMRDSFISLNGLWEYAFTATDTVMPEKYAGQILVPFSPETTLSGVGRQLKPGEYLWYRTNLHVEEQPLSSGMRLLLHFGAVDYEAQVYINGSFTCCHRGGYLPFETDITDLVQTGENQLVIKVQDATDDQEQARGKQSLKRGGIFYTAQSGIWQSVWMEWVPSCYIRRLWFETDYDIRQVTLHLEYCCHIGQPLSSSKTDIPLSLSVLFQEREILRHQQSADQTKAAVSADGKYDLRHTFTIPADDFHPWSPEHPSLYQVRLSLGADTVESYFAMRLFSVEKNNGIPVFSLNHSPYFLMGALDQGYWPESLYTAPDDQALIYDITAMKELGFNMLRKHLKVECARWYYHCDRLGMIVCQDMVNGGGSYNAPVVSYLPTLFPSLRLKDSHYKLFSRRDMEARKQWEQESIESIEHLRFFPSIAMWVIFNEGWGQFDTCRITELVRKKDPSRLIDAASGWYDQGCGDFVSIHNYFRPLSVSVKKWDGRAFFLSEYGGFACHIWDHSSVERIFGYKRFENLEELQRAYRELIQKSLLPLREQGLSGAVYTQLSDIEEEVNGILTYDRRINKLSSS